MRRDRECLSLGRPLERSNHVRARARVHGSAFQMFSARTGSKCMTQSKHNTFACCHLSVSPALTLIHIFSSLPANATSPDFPFFCVVVVFTQCWRQWLLHLLHPFLRDTHRRGHLCSLPVDLSTCITCVIGNVGNATQKRQHGYCHCIGPVGLIFFSKPCA